MALYLHGLTFIAKSLIATTANAIMCSTIVNYIGLSLDPIAAFVKLLNVFQFIFTGEHVMETT